MDDSIANRRSELLYLARKTRLQWIDAAEGAGQPGGAAGAGGLPARNQDMESLLSAMPAIKCLEDVLSFLTGLSGDSEQVQLASLVGAHLVPDDDEDVAPDYADMPPYTVFIAKLKRRSSTDLVKSMQSFVQGIEADMRAAAFSGTMEEKLQAVAEAVWVFLKKTLAAMRENACWAEESPEQWAHSKESLEIFLFTKLHRTLYVEDRAGDAELFERIQTLSFLSPEHLDIKSIVGDGVMALRRPVEVLGALSAAPNPLGKVLCLRECCAAISQSLSEFKQDGKFAGADEFLPVLILTIKEANPRQLKSNINYILHFTDPSKLASEAGYLLTQFVSAVQFLETVDASALTISPLEFEVAVARCRADARKLSGEFRERSDMLTATLKADAAVVVGEKDVVSTPRAAAAGPLAMPCSAVDVMMQRRKYSAPLRAASDPSLWKADNPGSTVRKSKNQKRDSRRPQACRLALLRALDRYDSTTHGEVISSWCGVVDADASAAENGSQGGDGSSHTESMAANTSRALLNYVSTPIETLSMVDVPKLLAEYKMLAKICSVLVSEQSPNRVAAPSSRSKHTCL